MPPSTPVCAIVNSPATKPFPSMPQPTPMILHRFFIPDSVPLTTAIPRWLLLLQRNSYFRRPRNRAFTTPLVLLALFSIAMLLLKD
ncbi:hypothetical protein FPQ18DRAFT_329443 [Pyronema domesticum]|nr:hypothetical protein FPQ18DRAFT_329443 [Pyronema domesticum]